MGVNMLTQVGDGFFKFFLNALGTTCANCLKGDKPFRHKPSGVLVHVCDGKVQACDGLNLWHSKGRA